MKKTPKVEAPKEIDISDFKYFIANDLVVVGVYKEDEEFVYFIVTKSDSYKRGTVGKLDKKNLQKEVEQGISVLIKDPVEAENYKTKGKPTPEMLKFIKEKLC